MPNAFEALVSPKPAKQPRNALSQLAGAQSVAPRAYFGYKVREKLYDGEDSYFKGNPHVSGMAAEDGQIIFNPYSKGVNFDAVGKNEAARLWMMQNKFAPAFNLTDAQLAAFKGTPYEKNQEALKHSILARIISGDPSAGQVTPEQRQWADVLMRSLSERK